NCEYLGPGPDARLLATDGQARGKDAHGHHDRQAIKKSGELFESNAVPIGAAPMLPGLDDGGVIRESWIARRVAENFYELGSGKGESAERPRKQRCKYHRLLAGLAKIEEQTNHTTENVGP